MSCNTVLISLIINKTTGKTISDFASEKLWIPIHATQPAYWSLDHTDGIEKSYCCFYSCARDFAKIGKLVLDSGKWDGKQIVSQEYIKTMLLGHKRGQKAGNHYEDFFQYLDGALEIGKPLY